MTNSGERSLHGWLYIHYQKITMEVRIFMMEKNLAIYYNPLVLLFSYRGSKPQDKNKNRPILGWGLAG